MRWLQDRKEATVPTSGPRQLRTAITDFISTIGGLRKLVAHALGQAWNLLLFNHSKNSLLILICVPSLGLLREEVWLEDVCPQSLAPGIRFGWYWVKFLEKNIQGTGERLLLSWMHQHHLPEWHTNSEPTETIFCYAGGLLLRAQALQQSLIKNNQETFFFRRRFKITHEGNVNWYNHYRKQYIFTLKFQNRITVWPGNPTPGVYQRTWNYCQNTPYASQHPQQHIDNS